MILNRFNDSSINLSPYKHIVCSNPFFSNELSLEILNWFEKDAPWNLVIADFYEQYEFDILNVPLPDHIKHVFSEKSREELLNSIEKKFQVKLSAHMDITAHKLVSSQIIKIHNDYRPGFESHRLLIQLNRGWSPTNGGLLMIFSKENEKFNLIKAINPNHNSSFAFEISQKSYHAVSEIIQGNRYTLVFSFYKA